MKWAIISIAQACELTLLEAIRRLEPLSIFRPSRRVQRSMTINWRDALDVVRRLYPSRPPPAPVERLFHLRHLLTHFEIDEPRSVAQGILDEATGWLTQFLAECLNEDLANWVASPESYQVLVGIEAARPHVRNAIQSEASWLAYRDKGTEVVLLTCPWCFEEALTASLELKLPRGTCIACGLVTSLEECERCGGTFAVEDLANPLGLCDGCSDYVASQ